MHSIAELYCLVCLLVSIFLENSENILATSILKLKRHGCATKLFDESLLSSNPVMLLGGDDAPDLKNLRHYVAISNIIKSCLISCTFELINDSGA